MPPRQPTSREDEVVFFGPSAVDLVKSRKGQVSEGTTSGEEWALSHLLPFFGDWPLPEIDAEAVDDYREFKVRESEARARAIERRRPQRNDRNQILKPLSPRTINKTINALQCILGVVTDGHRVELLIVERDQLRRPIVPSITAQGASSGMNS